MFAQLFQVKGCQRMSKEHMPGGTLRVITNQDPFLLVPRITCSALVRHSMRPYSGMRIQRSYVWITDLLLLIAKALHLPLQAPEVSCPQGATITRHAFSSDHSRSRLLMKMIHFSKESSLMACSIMHASLSAVSGSMPTALFRNRVSAR